jgi:hypothetical protein
MRVDDSGGGESGDCISRSMTSTKRRDPRALSGEYFGVSTSFLYPLVHEVTAQAV